MAAPKGHAKYGGRVAGTPNKATAEIRDLARADGPAVFKELVRLALESKNEQTRVAPRTPSASMARAERRIRLIGVLTLLGVLQYAPRSSVNANLLRGASTFDVE